VSNRFLGWPPAVLATLITVALVAGELADAGQRRWWATRPLTTDTGSPRRPPSWRAGRSLRTGRLRIDWRTDRATAAPLLQLLTPAIRDAINGIGQTAEE
jgi:hypothetical protein